MGISESFAGEVGDEISVFKVFQTLILVGCIVFPLSLMRDLSSARYISLAALISLTITLVVVMVEMPFYINDYHPTLSEEEKIVMNACPSFSFFNGVGIAFFAFTNHAQLLPIYNELDNPVKRRIMKVIKRSTFMVTIFYILMGMFGYFSTLGRTTDIVLLRETLPEMETDYFMIFA